MPAPLAPTPLNREEYIEQRHFFRVLRERVAQNVPSQDALAQVRDELLATTRLPIAVDLMRTEVLHSGRLSNATARLPHYFTPFQTFVLSRAEEDRSRFDMPVCLTVLERLAQFMSGEGGMTGGGVDGPFAGETGRVREPTPQGLFVYQFECVSRNRLGYPEGLAAVAGDPFYDEVWAAWLASLRRRIGGIEFADLIYHRSEEFLRHRRQSTGDPEARPPYPLLFGEPEGRIAWANRGKDPRFLFAALQRQLGYPRIPQPVGRSEGFSIHPELEARLLKLEKRLQFLEAEQKGGLDLDALLSKPAAFGDDPLRV